MGPDVENVRPLLTTNRILELENLLALREAELAMAKEREDKYDSLHDKFKLEYERSTAQMKELKTAKEQAASVGRVNVQNNELHAELNGLKVEMREVRVERGRVDALEYELTQLGFCVKCMQVCDHDVEAPFSNCACGTGEDYAERPLQRLQIKEAELSRATEQMKNQRKEIATLKAEAVEQVIEIERQDKLFRERNELFPVLNQDQLNDLIDIRKVSEQELEPAVKDLKGKVEDLKEDIISRNEDLAEEALEIKTLKDKAEALKVYNSQLQGVHTTDTIIAEALRKTVEGQGELLLGWAEKYKLVEDRLKESRLEAKNAIEFCGRWMTDDDHACPTCGIPHGKQQEVDHLTDEVEKYRDRLQTLWTWLHNAPSEFYDLFDDEDRLK